MTIDPQDYEDHHFQGVVEIDASLEDLHFQNCTFTGCHFTQSSFDHCIFEDCRFERCDLSLLSVANSSFIECHFSDSKCVGINWTVAGPRLSLHFERCILNTSSFMERKIPELNLIECQAHEVNFAQSKLPWANLSKSDFNKARFNQTDLTDANFTGATNYAINGTENIIKGATFSLPEAVSLLDGFQINLV